MFSTKAVFKSTYFASYKRTSSVGHWGEPAGFGGEVKPSHSLYEHISQCLTFYWQLHVGCSVKHSSYTEQSGKVCAPHTELPLY